MKKITLASTLDPTGEKRISLYYDDDTNVLYVDEEGIGMIPLNNSTLYDNMINKKIEELKNDLNFCCKGCSKYFYDWYNQQRVFRRNTKPTLTKKEQLIGYYYFCMTNNFGQGNGVMFSNYPQIPFHIIELKWNLIRDKYIKLGYEI